MSKQEPPVALSVGSGTPSQHRGTAILERTGFITFAADSAGEALHLCGCIGSVDLVVAGLDLPDMEPLEFAARAARLAPRVAILFTCDAPEALHRLVEDGVELVPVPLAGLAHAVAAYRRDRASRAPACSVPG